LGLFIRIILMNHEGYLRSATYGWEEGLLFVEWGNWGSISEG
jgi:hypothetical protein